MRLFEFNDRKPWENPKFKQWFGDSKVVDEHGRPLVLFHGTAYDFDAFENDVIWASAEPKLASAYAEQRVEWDNIEDQLGSNVIPVYMKVERPFNADQLGHTTRIDDFLLSLLEQASENGVGVGSFKEQTKDTWVTLVQAAKEEESGPVYETHNMWYKPDWYFGKKASAKLHDLFFSLQFDGIVYSEINPISEQDAMTWGTFYKENVKSAIGNMGTYSTSSASISEHQVKRIP